ncbi:uncharacterized protein MONBRDRAFT_24383 [Monosiga brevicollis MX1]|uniref:P-type domain-containing protein n=1 Tax=Monosiga brevicollis TaxID=81824 RepID=A9UW91_MONBE|nr:uncharacterized protein MONBRDRAFT_24383 [Monosiga brevicollis MX1]EDQ90724.1 predicted protein [Monosiga brevicollis MX1]|eukprot:XP_001744775.1 hypothetical protein [Monosiga brevicollis MX1]
MSSHAPGWMLLAAALLLAHGHLPLARAADLGPLVWGANIHFSGGGLPGEVEQIARAIKIVRMDFGWGSTERTKGVYDFSAFDELLGNMSSQGVRNYWILDYGNALYTNDSNTAPATDEAIQAFAKWSAAAMTHFQGHNVIWELYNEPNIPTQSQYASGVGAWFPYANATTYMRLYHAVMSAKTAAGKSAAPLSFTLARLFQSCDLICVGTDPGLDDVSLVAPASAGIPTDFLVACFEQGMLDTVDGVSLHPYRAETPETVMADYAALRALMKNYTSRDVPLISGEWGYSTCANATTQEPMICNHGAYTGQNTLRGQAKFLVRQWLINALESIPVSIYYDWRNGGGDTTEGEQNFGITYSNYNNASLPFVPKPAYTAAVVLQEQINSSTFSTRIDAFNTSGGEPDSNAFALAFAGGDKLASDLNFVIKCMRVCVCVGGGGGGGISEQQCVARGCCYLPDQTAHPWCNFPGIGNFSGSISFTTSANTTYSRVSMLGEKLDSVTTNSDGHVTVVVDDEPQYWTRT